MEWLVVVGDRCKGVPIRFSRTQWTVEKFGEVRSEERRALVNNSVSLVLLVEVEVEIE